MEKYNEWIKNNIDGDGYGQCAEVTEKMDKEFPELTRVRGHYYCLILEQERAHWWMKDKNGNIIDPTKNQFSSSGIFGEYIEWIEGTTEPTGKCPNCGGYCFNGNYFCKRACEIEYVDYMNGNLSRMG